MQQFFAQTQHFWSVWSRVARSSVDGLEKVMGDLADMQAHGVRRADEAADEMSKVFKASLGYAASVADQLRTVTVDTARRTVDVVAPEA